MIPNISERWPYIKKSIGRLYYKDKKAQNILLEIAEEDLQKIEASRQTINVAQLKSLSQERQENLISFWLNYKNNIQISSAQITQVLTSILKSSQGSSESYVNTKIDNSKCKIVISSQEINIINKNIIKQ